MLAFIYARRNDSFCFVRNMFMIAMALAVIGYWLYPTAPPRLMPEWGFTDAISSSSPAARDPSTSDRPGIRELLRRSPLDARLLRGDDRLIDVAATRWRPGKILWALYPLLITFVVVATANHFLTDVFLGALTAGASALLAQRLLARARPDVWAFTPSEVDRLTMAGRSRPRPDDARADSAPAGATQRRPAAHPAAADGTDRAGDDAQPADRVAAHPECDLADRLRP